MSGIIGIISTAGAPVGLARLHAMSAALALRGPDDDNLWLGEHVGFGHRMLCTTPESHEEILPYHDVETGLVITSDARLDNRDELLALIGETTFTAKVVADSLIILRAYLKWQEDCVHHLLGDFSFAIWDTRGRNLFCARDHLGIKPFYYYYAGGVFLFCSESSVIAHHSGSPITTHEPRIGDHFTPHLEGLDKTSTFYTGIHRLPPAHFLQLRQDRLSIGQYWKPEPSGMNELKSDQHYLDEFNEILHRAVADRCRGIDNPSVLLSGGVDSATIMGISRHLYKDKTSTRVHTFSGVSDDMAACKESRMIAVLTGSDGITPHLFSPADLAQRVDTLFAILEKLQEPFDFCMVLTFLLYQQAGKAGSRVVLDGVDGDIMASLAPGYPANLFGTESFTTVLQETIRQSRGYYTGLHSPSKLFFHYLLSAYTPTPVKEWRWRLGLPAKLRKSLSETGLDGEFAKRVKLQERLLQFEKDNRKPKQSFPHGQYLSEVQHPFLTVGIERYDRVASLCSVEPRHPLLDKRIVDFYAGLPWNQFVRHGWTKFLLRRVGQQFVPQEICWQPGIEHVGWQFTEKIVHLKKKEIMHTISAQLEPLNIISKPEFAFQQAINYNATGSSRQRALCNNVAGLALWLRKNSILREDDATP